MIDLNLQIPAKDLRHDDELCVAPDRHETVMTVRTLFGSDNFVIGSTLEGYFNYVIPKYSIVGVIR